MSLVAGLALAETAVQSANIVGYLEFAGTSTFNFTGATFTPVGTDGSAMKLGDIKVNSAFELGVDGITIFNASGDKVFKATYVDAATAKEYDCAEGWYDVNDIENEDVSKPKNDYDIPYGSGLVFNRANANARILYRGEVFQDAKTIAGTGTFNFICNSSPVDLKLRDIKVNSAFELGVDGITIFNDSGDKVFKATYVDAATAKEYDCAEGWYDVNDIENEDVSKPKNDYDIPAGKGFVFNRANSGARVIVPNPMPAK